MINPYDREQVIALLRSGATALDRGQDKWPTLASDLHQLADHLEQED